MAAFDKTLFTGTTTVLYGGKFVARFKRGGRADFIKFLCKNFTVEEYFHRLEVDRLPPLTILEAKGFVAPRVCKMLVEAGYEPTVAGLKRMIANQIANYGV